MAATHVTAAAEASAVAATETCMSAEAAVTSAVLSPQGYCQEKRERRDGDQAAHKQSIRPISGMTLSNFV